MGTEARFGAPWGVMLKILTLGLTAMLLGIAAIGLFSGPRENHLWILGMVVTPLVVIVVSAPFAILGYELREGALYVQRLGWQTRLDLSSLESAEVDPEAMSRSIKLFGDGGFFCFAGLFRNKRLGTYRAFATSPKNAVVLRFAKRTIVATPAQPEAFAAKAVEIAGR